MSKVSWRKDVVTPKSTLKCNSCLYRQIKPNNRAMRLCLHCGKPSCVFCFQGERCKKCFH